MALTLYATLLHPERIPDPEDKTSALVFEPEDNPDIHAIMGDASRIVHQPTGGARVIVLEKIGGHTERIRKLNLGLRELVSVTLQTSDVGIVMTGYNESSQTPKRTSATPGKLSADQRKQLSGGDTKADSSASAAKDALKRWGLSR